MISLRQLAKLCGLSICTVSRALKDDERVKDTTRAQVKEMARVHNYKPNQLVSGIFKGRSKTVALITPDASEDPTAQLFSQIEINLRAAGYVSLMFNTLFDAKTEADCLRIATEHRVSGVIISTVSYEASEAHYRELRRDKIPFVLVAEYSPRVSVPHIHSDDAKQAAALVKHLREFGHRRIAHIAGPKATYKHSLRLAGFLEAMQDAGLKVPAEYLVNTDWSLAGGKQAMQQLIQSPHRPTAIFAATDQLAVGALQAAREAGLRVPQDVSIVGMGDASFARLVTPPLTTVAKNRDVLAARAVEVLLLLIDSDPDQPIRKELLETVVPGDLVVRESSGPVPSQ